MALGWVYIPTNPAMPGLLKIGQSSADPDLRSEALFTTGVPEPFTVAYKGLFQDYARLERLVHGELLENRHRAEREFFRVDIRSAITVIHRMSETGPKYEETFGPTEAPIEAVSADWRPSPAKGLTVGQVERERRRQVRLAELAANSARWT